MEVLVGLADWQVYLKGVDGKNGNSGKQDALYGRNTSYLAAWKQDKKKMA